MRAVGERTEAGGSAAPARKRSLTGRGVLGLQRKAGNSAVARLILQRRASAGAPPAPVGLAPRDDPRFRKVESELKQTNKTLTSHPPGTAEAGKAAAAAEPPVGDRDAQAKAAKADKMAGAKPGGFDKAAFMAAVRRAIAAKAPQNLDEADKFATSGAAGSVKSDVMANVTGGKEASAKDIAAKTAEAPDASKARDKPVTPLKEDPAPKPPAPNAAAAMPTPAPPEQTQLDGPKHDTDAQMAEAGVTEKQLAESNEPEFTGALAAKKAGEQHSATAPGEVREAEAQTLQSTARGAGATGKSAVAAMISTRAGAQGLVGGDKSQAKAKDEAARSRITADINRIFDATKSEVDGILTGLDASVAALFDSGATAATAAFEADHKTRMQRYKDLRYEGLEGAARWTADLFTGLPKEANDLFLESRKLYETKMDKVISDIADHIGTELGRATERIAQGRKQIDEYVASQPKDLQKVAKDCAGDIDQRLGQLQSDVDAKGEALVDDLATRYSEARQAIDDRITELQEANKGLWDKAKDAVGGAIDTVLKLKDMLTGVLARAAGAIDKIITDPVGFLGKLVNAVRGGVTQFASNIVQHLKKGLQGWLFGTLASAGIEIPDTLDLRGIIRLVLSVLGLTWTRIRTKIVRRIGEAAMNALETGVDFFKTIVTKGIGGLWTFLVDKLSDLKDVVMSAIQDFVVVKIVKAGIVWLISALNPAAAFVKACKMIYDVVMFFVEKGSQIKEFVDSVLDSIEEIAGGAVGRVAGFIENTLAKILPLLIGFLASLLGLGGISEKIKEILKKVQEPVSKAVDFVINGALKLAAPVINLAKKGVAWVKGKLRGGDDSPEGKQKRLDAGLGSATSAVNRFAGKRVGQHVLKPILGAIKLRYGLTTLDVVPSGQKWAVNAEINPKGQRISDVEVLDDQLGGEAAARFAELANRVEREFFATEISAEGPMVRSATEQAIAGSVGRQGAGAIDAGQAQTPANLTGVSSAEQISAQVGVATAHARETGGQGLPRFATFGSEQGDQQVTGMVNPTRAQPFNVIVNQVGAYGSDKPGDVMSVIGHLRSGGMTDAGISRAMEESSRTGQPITEGLLRQQGFTGTFPAAIPSGRGSIPLPAALGAITRLTHVIEPTRFLERGVSPSGVGFSQQPIATTTAMGHQMVQGGAADLGQLMDRNAPLAPATGARLGETGRLRQETIASSQVRITMLVEHVRRAWQAWYLQTNQNIAAEIKARGIENPQLVPTEEHMKQLLRRFYGEAKAAIPATTGGGGGS